MVAPTVPPAFLHVVELDELAAQRDALAAALRAGAGREKVVLLLADFGARAMHHLRYRRSALIADEVDPAAEMALVAAMTTISDELRAQGSSPGLADEASELLAGWIGEHGKAGVAA